VLRAGVAFSKVDPPIPELNRFFYAAIGGSWFWIERRSWTYAQWAAQVGRPDELETWILTVDGVPAGYVELERCADRRVEIVYFGLLAAYIGQGLGAHLLTCAVERAFEMGATKVTLNTCNLDHPQALMNYQARGFREVRTEVRQKEVPPVAPGPWEGAGTTNTARDLLRHALAVVAYRGAKALRGAPASFAHFAAGPTSREPVQILAHINDLYDWALWLAKGEWKWSDSAPGSWESETARFHAGLQAFDDYLASGAPIHMGEERVLAGPIADSLTHIGQINYLRRLAGSPVRGESYARAEIVTGRVGPEQAPPVREFE